MKLEEGVNLPEVVVTSNTSRYLGGWAEVIVFILLTNRKTDQEMGRCTHIRCQNISQPFRFRDQADIRRPSRGEYTLRIFSNNGQELYQRKTQLSAFQEMELNLASLNLPAAAYWLHITNGKGKVFKQQLMKINR